MQETIIQISGFIHDNFHKHQLFYTVKHPSRYMFAYLAQVVRHRNLECVTDSGIHGHLVGTPVSMDDCVAHHHIWYQRVPDTSIPIESIDLFSR